MPRKSAQSFEIVAIEGVSPRLEAPKHLSSDEAALFRQIVSQSTAMHFARSDSEVLALYCQSAFLTAKAYAAACQSPDNLRDWEKCVRVMASLAGKLRLCPSARIDPKSLGRAYAGTSYASYPDLDRIDAAKAGTTGRGWKAKA